MITQSPFGRTGHLSTRALFGAASLSRVTQAEADRTLDLLLQYGVNHIDTAFSYGDAELRIGPWMKRYRKEFFLATKTGERTYQAAREGIHRSLERLQTDHVDLLQFHHLVEPDEWEVALGPGGALEAAVEAREQGLVRFIGVTGHEARDCRDASAQPGAVRLRLSAVAVQLSDHAEPAVRGQLRESGGDLPGTQRGRAGHQGDTAASLG